MPSSLSCWKDILCFSDACICDGVQHIVLYEALGRISESPHHAPFTSTTTTLWRRGQAESWWPCGERWAPQGGAALNMINGLARSHGHETCLIHEGFHLHVSENPAPVMVPAGCRCTKQHWFSFTAPSHCYIQQDGCLRYVDFTFFKRLSFTKSVQTQVQRETGCTKPSLYKWLYEAFIMLPPLSTDGCKYITPSSLTSPWWDIEHAEDQLAVNHHLVNQSCGAGLPH